MAIIPNDEKFIGLSASVDTTERRSALINAESQAYTMQDITDTVSATIPAPVNPTSGTYPINKNGVFADSGLQNAVLFLPPWYSGASLGLKYYDDFAGQTLLALDPLNMVYTFGDATFTPGSSVSASAGISIQSPMGQMIIGCGVSSPTNGVFKVDAASGNLYIGTTPMGSIGVNMFLRSVIIGSLINSASNSPVDPVNPVSWIKIQDENGNFKFVPSYV